MEQVMLRSSATQAKIIGTIVSISGALVIVLYKGPKLLVAASFTSCEPSWIIGGLLLVLQFLLLSVWYILQVLDKLKALSLMVMLKVELK